MKRFVILMMVVMVFVAMTASPVDAAKKHSKKSKKVGMKVVSKKTKKSKMTIDMKSKVVTIHCPVCGDGTHEDCPYWCGFNNGTEYRHMTDAEIADYEFYESHYQTEDGEWHVR